MTETADKQASRAESANSGWRRGQRRVAVFRALGAAPGVGSLITGFFLKVAPRVDRLLLRATNGRVNMALGLPVLLLTHQGAKTGAMRETPLAFFGGDDGSIVLIASQGGRPGNPAWYHNLRANPDVDVTIAGRRRELRAREAEGEERERLWQGVVELAPNYDDYRLRVPDRQIPVMVLDSRPAPLAGTTELPTAQPIG